MLHFLNSPPIDEAIKEKESGYTKSDIDKAIEFGIILGSTAGYFEGNDSWIDEKYDKFYKSLSSTPKPEVKEQEKEDEVDRWRHIKIIPFLLK